MVGGGIPKKRFRNLQTLAVLARRLGRRGMWLGQSSRDFGVVAETKRSGEEKRQKNVISNTAPKQSQ